MADQTSPVHDEPVPAPQDKTEGISLNGSEPAEEKKKVPTFIWIVGAILLIILAGLVAFSFLPDDVLARLRDVAIVFSVFLFFFLMVLLLILVAALIYAINRISDRLDDLGQRGGAVLDEVKGTARTVKGTAGFVGERIASPFIRMASWGAGFSEGVRTFLRGPRKSVEKQDERKT